MHYRFYARVILHSNTTLHTQTDQKLATFIRRIVYDIWEKYLNDRIPPWLAVWKVGEKGSYLSVLVLNVSLMFRAAGAC